MYLWAELVTWSCRVCRGARWDSSCSWREFSDPRSRLGGRDCGLRSSLTCECDLECEPEFELDGDSLLMSTAKLEGKSSFLIRFFGGMIRLSWIET